jgi:uncharacterized protein (TIGR03083 family)
MRRPLPRIETLDLIRETNEALVDLLESLSPADWLKPTVHEERTVKDLAAHLLDGSLRRLAVERDGFVGERYEGSSFADLVAFIQRLNREWIVAARRLSPQMLVRMIREADEEVSRLFTEKDPSSRAAFAVAWAGEDQSEHWFDVAREYTEKWHHQQQIRDAVARPDLASRRHLHPVIATFVRAMPYAYREVSATDDTKVQLSIGGEASSVWCLTRDQAKWHLEAKVVAEPACEVVLDADVAWRLWTKGLRSHDAPSRIAIHGDVQLAAPLLAMTCVMA